MPLVVPVKFAFASRDLWFDPQGIDIVQADHAICKTERGTEIGLVTADPFEVPLEEVSAPLKPVLRVATDEDLERADELAQAGDEAMHDFRRLIKQNGLDMKPVGVEYLFGGERVVFYFAAEDRVDFRQLVRDLSSCFHTRVDMRQIGVRDETRLMGGFAHCGQELCCARFGGNFEPVSIRMAKEQDLPLNSSKISGVCGRLMCCLRYEFEAYKDFKGRAPKKKALIDTPLGKARIVEYNTPREQLVLRLESGKVFRVDLADMTCSDEAKKRSEEQGCACRPDCVTRDIMDRIESPEIRLALLELDRQNGVDVGDGLSTADRIEDSAPAQRRRRGRSGEQGDSARGERTAGERQGRQGGKSAAQQAGKGGRQQGATAGKGRPQEDEASTGRRRRRHAEAPAAEGAQQPTAAGSSARSSEQGERAADPSQGASRRRRHRAAEGSGEAGSVQGSTATSAAQGTQGGSGAASAGSGSSRRRHRSQAGGSSGGTASRSQKPDTRSVAEQVADGQVQVTRRRPGDGGGRRSDEAAGAEGAEGASAASSAQDQAPHAGQEGQQAAPQGQKRRRKRSRKPKQEGGAAGAEGGASASPSLGAPESGAKGSADGASASAGSAAPATGSED